MIAASMRRLRAGVRPALPMRRGVVSIARGSLQAASLSQQLALWCGWFRLQTTRQGVAFNWQIDEHLAPVLRLPTPTLSLLIRLLLRHAIQHASGGSLQLQVQAWAQQQMRQLITVEISVHHGMAVTALQPSSRQTSKSSQGMPPLARLLARQLGGALRLAESEHGWGCSLQLWLQMVPDHETHASPNGEAAAALPVLDHSVLQAFSMGDAGQELALLQGFVQHKREDLLNLLQAWQCSDMDELILLAHRIKGASASVGARALSHAASQLEQAGRSRQQERLPLLLQEVELQLEAFAVYLQQWALGLNPGTGMAQ
ncbi:MAG: Hpt domain-containing protein [Aquitalea sp.]|nr:Hpt domain-containing protein [Aquitalea sp.]